MTLIAAIPVTSKGAGKKDLAEVQRQGIDRAELRIDYMPGIENYNALDPWLEELLAENNIPKIVTCRPEWEGGLFKGDATIRLRSLQHAANLGAEYVDLELDAQYELERWKTKLIISKHDFKKTPSNADLETIAQRIIDRGADIGKIAVMAESHADVLRLLDFTASISKKLPFIVVPMGKYGIIGRILATEFGSESTFVALDGRPTTGPGQLTISGYRQARYLLQLE